MATSNARAKARARTGPRAATAARPDTDRPTTAGRFFVGANFHEAGPLIHYARCASRRDYRWTSDQGVPESDFELPRRATLGFRNIFWTVFDEVVEVLRCDVRINWLETDWILHSVWVINSIDADSSVSLSERANIFLFFELSAVRPVDRRYIHSKTFELGLNEQSSIAALLTAVEHLPRHGEFLCSHRHIRDFPGRFIHYVETVEDDVSDLLCVLAFYSYCLLFIWQINRFQAAIKMDAGRGESLSQLSHVLGIRAHIINIERHFLTTNVTNDPGLKLQARRIRDQFQLRSKFENFLTINQSIETYIATSSQITSERRSKVINYMAFLFGAVSIPLALVQSVLSFGPDKVITSVGPLRSLPLLKGFPLFLRDLMVLYVLGLIVMWLLFGFGLNSIKALAERGLSIARHSLRGIGVGATASVEGGNQKKRIFAGSPPRSASTNSAARNSPPAT